MKRIEEIVPVVWRCLCGTFNTVEDKRCIVCGRKRSW